MWLQCKWIAVLVIIVVKDLCLHAEQMRLGIDTRANPDTVVAARVKLDLQTENEVGIFLCREEMHLASRFADQHPIANIVAALIASQTNPAVE